MFHVTNIEETLQACLPRLSVDLLFLPFVSVILILCISGCHEESPVVDTDSNDATQIDEGSWITYSPIKWTHDGLPYNSVYCTVYSDGAGHEMKEKAGIFTDAKFLEILELFNYDNHSDLSYPPGRNKIDVYLNTEHERSIAAAYWGSIFITVRTPELDTTLYEYLFKHELTHTFEFLIEGTVNLGTDVWFKEGVAMFGGGGRGYIKDVDDLEHWISLNEESPNCGNPITIHAWEDFPEGSDIPGYYTVFEVVMLYILDPEGMGKSLQDVLNLFYELRDGESFEDAFHNNFGITVGVLEDEIFERLRTFLNNPLENNESSFPIHKIDIY